MPTYHHTEADRAEGLRNFRELPGLYLAMGKLQAKQTQMKPGSEGYARVEKQLDEIAAQAHSASDVVAVFLRTAGLIEP